MRNTLAFRIIALSSVWIIIALVFTGVMLVINHRDHTAQHYDAHVQMHLEELIGASHFTEDGRFRLAFNPSDPRYRDLHSGWYWEVKQAGKTLKRSASLGENSLDLKTTEPTTDLTIREFAGPQSESLRVHVVEIAIDPDQEPLVFLATAPTGGITEDVVDYANHISVSFFALGVGLLLAVGLQVRVALKPFKAISTRIADIRAGKANKLPEHQLEDVQPLVDELNTLLDHNAVLVKRARNQLGDLAHSVKNPLTVINNAAREMEAEQKDLILQQTTDISRSVDHYLSRARTFGTEKVLGSRYSIKTAAEDLVYAMQRIYQERDLVFDLSRLQGCWFKGEGQDMEEMLGNLLDNACKWAKSRVLIYCGTKNGRLEIVIEDDGPGIAEMEFDKVVRRGRRLDESIPGHGQGLGIVKDIAALYGGALKLARAELGGLQAKLDLPSA
ncbi:MAG: sensor histidine kinase [Xanthomonadales bacterium]|nr:sensor histidine kinase [Xanthomonadales bacterium]